jgi:23S rRNA U2552 (ribose-2'-O)-methylase RlmE/FtsJ
MSFVEDPKYKNKNFYHVINSFEHTITNLDKNKLDIASYSKMYFKIGENSKVNIVSRAFYKLWEILLVFDLVPKKTGQFITAHLAEAPGSFVQSIIFYREKFYKSSDYSKDEHYVVSISEDSAGIPTFKKDFRTEYSRVKIYEQDGGDLTDIKSIDKFAKFSKKADLITADGGFIWNDENYQEQEAYRLIIGEILTAIKIQERDIDDMNDAELMVEDDMDHLDEYAPTAPVNTMEAKDGLWDNIRKKKQKEGKNYKPAKTKKDGRLKE